MGKTIAAQAEETRRGRCVARDNETNTQGVGISSGTATGFASDALRFTGVDMGDRERGVVRRGNYVDSEEDDDEDGSSSSEDEEFEEYLAQLSVRDREEALVQSALRRIDRAKAKGRTDVSLNKEEIAALERHRQRMAEAEKKKRSKKRRDQRVAVPLTELDPGSRKKKSRQESRTRHSSSTNSNHGDQDHQGYPPMGYFPPPSTTGRRRSGTTTSSQRAASRARDERSSRHPSDAAAPPYGDIPVPGMSPTSSRAALDVFQYQTASQAANPMASSRRPFSGAPQTGYPQRGAGSMAWGQSGSQSGLGDGSSEEESEGSEDDSERGHREEQSSSDDVGNGAQIRDVPRGRGPAVPLEPSPEAEAEPEAHPVRRNPPRASTSSKKKPVRSGGGGGGRRKK
ncbi:hypothetical protein LCI18_001513 [Fusarium solani-melongenae]|uniref:Uncharacterized protein n=1 Tax=Fusarium solani subsp. cucurbitae TaxID=2747967 RepID=A0ACD3YNR6_FUSSC|nr:hypothetical protein LCI18_001513 [Fusarium solani-melongenae]